MIVGYPSSPSILPGEILTLHVSTDQSRFYVQFYRQGKALEPTGNSEWMVGQHSTDGPHDKDWEWPAYTFTIPADWPSSAYIAMFYEEDEQGNVIAPDVTNADGRDSKALFVVRNSSPGQSATILYKLPLFTYHAYNGAVIENSLYDDQGGKVTLRRPGGGTGGTPWDKDFTDVYANSSPRETFQHWDAPFISWLERNGYAVDYCTDLDIHENRGNFLASYSLLLSVGQDEYWSAEMRQNVEDFIRNGGNVAFFSANTCWWRVSVVDGNSAISCDKSVHGGHELPFDQWYRFNPENKLTGVSYRNGDGCWTGEREAVGYTVQYCKHWVYKDTGLEDGEVFGADEHLVGYECDGALFEEDQEGRKKPTGADGTPLDFIILGIGEITVSKWDECERINPAATMGLYTNNGTVFTAATTDWSRVLTDSKNPIVDRITRNVLDRLK
jgi:hypothetical protein